MHRRTALASFLLSSSVLAQTKAPFPTNKVDVGMLLPEYDAEWLGTQPAKPPRHMLIDFWATWCGPCIEHFPFLNVLAHSYMPRGLDIVAMTKEPATTVQTFLRNRETRFLIACEGTQQLQDLLQIKGIPHTILVGPDRKVLWSGHPTAKLPLLIEQALKAA